MVTINFNVALGYLFITGIACLTVGYIIGIIHGHDEALRVKK